MAKKTIIATTLALLAACGPTDHETKDRGPDGTKQGLIASDPDQEGYVTSAFQGVREYGPTAMMNICVTLAVQSGKMPNAILLSAKAEQANFGKINEEASSLLLKDAANFWSINTDIDQDAFWSEHCKVPMENLNSLYGG